MNLKHLLTFMLVLVPTSVFASQKYWDRSLTILLAEGQEDCYFLPNVKATQEVDVEFQVCKKSVKIYYTFKLFSILIYLHRYFIQSIVKSKVILVIKPKTIYHSLNYKPKNLLLE